MQAHTRIAFILVFVGLVGITAYKWLQPHLNEAAQKVTSDSANIKATIHIAVDGWVGYFPLCSPLLADRMRQIGYRLVCVDDAANYPERFKKLKKGDYQFAVATVDSYILNAATLNFPASIVAVIDESKGGDALVAWQAALPSLEALKSDSAIKIAFTPHSPSHHLLKVLSAHFDIPRLRNAASHVPTDGSDAAYKALTHNTVQAAVLWEPDVSKALQNKEIIKLLSTEETQGLIVDILLASRDVVQNDPELIESLLSQYFRVLKQYRDDPSQLKNDIADHYKVSSAHVEAMIQGVEWASLSANAQTWYGVGTSTQRALVDAIDSTVDIFIEVGDFDVNPLPKKDPYTLTYSAAIHALWDKVVGGTFRLQDDDSKTGPDFSKLSESEWARLKEVGALKVRPILFTSGTSELTEEGMAQLERLYKDLKHYPRFRLEVRGHTGSRGDASANQVLSQQRADAVREYLISVHQAAPERIRAVGFGADKPLVQLPGESFRAYQYRLPRVEITLLEEEF